MERKISIDGKEYRMIANGATPRIYRALFKSEVFLKMAKAVTEEGEVLDTEVFENLAYCMAVQGGSIPQDKTIGDWLGEMSSPMAIINAADAIMAMWVDETNTTSVGKKE